MPRPAAEAAAALFKFRQDLRQQFQVIENDAPLLVAAVRAVEVHGLRAYDAVQLAAALTLITVQLASAHPPVAVVSADLKLNAAARAEGLLVEDPNNYP
ncbi:MAG: type II toxin-antitoxin system VapC family toxin [Pirellulales bacterium]